VSRVIVAMKEESRKTRTDNLGVRAGQETTWVGKGTRGRPDSHKNILIAGRAIFAGDSQRGLKRETRAAGTKEGSSWETGRTSAKKAPK